MVRTSRATRAVAVIAGASVFALGLTACGDKTDDGAKPAETSKGSQAGKEITLSVATFNTFGYDEAILKEYEDANPGIKIEHVKAATADDARTNLTTRIAAGGEGLADVEAIDIDWMQEFAAIEDKFEDLSSPEIEGRWLDWKTEQGKTPSGKLIGAGTDIGPEAVCYRADLFEKAGLPTDRKEVAELFGGADATWEDFYKVGQQYAEKTGKPFYDSASAIWQAKIGQVKEPFENAADGSVKDLAGNADVKAIFEEISEQSEKLSAHLSQWSDDWNAAFQNDGFAVMLCPSWMTANIKQNSGGVEGWDIADVFPGQYGNWGGSFLTVPSTGKNIEEAKKLALWLTAPEQQARFYLNVNTFPSQVDALKNPEVLAHTDEFFNDAPAGEIFSNRAQAISADKLSFKGENYFKVNGVITEALKKVDTEQSASAAEAWDQAIDAFKNLGLN